MIWMKKELKCLDGKVSVKKNISAILINMKILHLLRIHKKIDYINKIKIRTFIMNTILIYRMKMNKKRNNKSKQINNNILIRKINKIKMNKLRMN
jgi:hypothetical protein